MTRGLPIVLACMLLTAGCRCRNGEPVKPVELGLNVTPEEVDFGRVLQGERKTLQVTLQARTRAPIELTLETVSPFSVSPRGLRVPGGSIETVDVTFLAGDSPSEGQLEIHVGEQLALVALRGVGVAPLNCVPSGECIVSTYSLEEDRCIEAPAPDDTSCDPGSVCLEQGRCRTGACLGIARSCDDHNPCTDDACALDAGCIATPHACPLPTAACTVATCDPTTGCGFGPAADFTLCGPSDCVTVQFCQSGVCRSLAAPDGLTCGPPVACLPEAKCHEQRCQRDTEGEWMPDWSARLAVEPSNPITSVNGTLFLSVCVADAGMDAGVADAGLVDAGKVDGGDDAGLDAGVVFVCGLTSMTASGFERFTLPYDDAQPRRLLSARSGGVVLLRDGGLEVRSTTSGAVTGELEFTGRVDQLVIAASSLSFIRDGGLFTWRSDGGIEQLGTADDQAELAHGQLFFSWNASTETLTRYLETDAGLQLEVLSVPDAGPGLTVADGFAALGATGVMAPDASFVTFVGADAGGVVLPGRTLLASSVADVFELRCEDGGCAEWVRAVDMSTGLERWSALVRPASPLSTTVSTSLVSVAAGSLVALVREEADGGPVAYLELLSEGEKLGICRLPAQSGNVELAHFSSNAMVVTTRRADGGLVIESYPLNALPISQTGWPIDNGVRGTRSDRP